MKKLTKKQLRELGVYNPWGIAENSTDLFINYSSAITGRVYKSASWQVVHVKYKTDPEAHFLDYGRKTFDVHSREEKQVRLNEAILWASVKYKIANWEKSVFGSYHPKGSIEMAIKNKAMKKVNNEEKQDTK